MTKEQEKEIRRYLEIKGISSDCIDGAVKSIRFHETTKVPRDYKDVKRGRDIMKFEPNPGKATLTQVGETQTYIGGDDHGLPIYQEDVDMIKKALPLARRLIELQKMKPQEPEKPLSEMSPQEKADYFDAKEKNEKQTLRTLRDTIDEVYDVKPEELNMGPDTTENINEISDEKCGGLFNPEAHENEPAAKSCSRWAITINPSKCSNFTPKYPEDNSDIMWYFDPESENHKPAIDDLSEEERMNLESGWYAPKRGDRTISREQMIESMEKAKEAAQIVSLKDSSTKEYYTYSNILKRMDDTHTRKNNDYGDAAYLGYKKYGDPYFLVQLHNKLSRLESLTVKNKTWMVKDESIDDTLLDMANYAVMYLESRHRYD